MNCIGTGQLIFHFIIQATYYQEVIFQEVYIEYGVNKKGASVRNYNAVKCLSVKKIIKIIFCIINVILLALTDQKKGASVRNYNAVKCLSVKNLSRLLFVLSMLYLLILTDWKKGAVKNYNAVKCLVCKKIYRDCFLYCHYYIVQILQIEKKGRR
jgi:hypothetical protein